MELSLRGDLEPPLNVPIASRDLGARINSDGWVIGAAIAALVAKVAIALNTFGTNDVAALYTFARLLRDHGSQWMYQNGVPWSSNSSVFNHPPLTAYYLELIESLSRNEFFHESGLTFPFLLRIPGIIADLVTVFVLLRISKIIRQIPAWSLLLFALSPVSVMVSGFHGNTDGVMIMFLVSAAYMFLRDKPVACGILFALSCQIKVIPLLLLPIFLFFWMSRRVALRFCCAFLLLMIVMWSQPLLVFPGLFARNVLSYGSYWGSWGITYWLQLTRYGQFNASRFDLPPAATIVALILKAGIISTVLVISWRRRHLAAAAAISSIAYAWIIFFVLTPGFCAYYLIWLAPFVLILSPQFYIWVTAASSLFLFFFYNNLTGGFPWFIGVLNYNSPDRLNLIAPWSLWPWATLLCGMILFWRKAVSADPSFCLLSLKSLSPNASGPPSPVP